MAVFSLGNAQQLFGQAGEYDQIVVKANAGVPATQLRDRIAAVLPAGDQAQTATTASANAAQQINSQLGILTDFFLSFAGIALFVGAFVIWNTFSIMIGQRTRELALTRALGASRSQLFRSVLAEAAIVAAVASVAGAALGLGLPVATKCVVIACTAVYDGIGIYAR
jgi:putative ABC transport system permease protein